ncbi:MAG: hypothetical protein E7106_07945 [Prevotella sp.]|nr:hypothetical protein [Prevotella sp.]
MKQTLENYIRQNENFRQVLLKQDSGFIKFFVEHSEDEDVNGTWYQLYQDYVFSNYRKANSIDPDVMLLSLDEQRKEALGGSHMREEFRQRKELEKILTRMPKEAAEAVQEVRHLADGYLAFAFHQHIERSNPDHATDVGFYRCVIEQYSFSDGLFYRCMNIVLKEHHGQGLTENDQYDAYRILEYRHFYLRRDDCYARLRRAVKEILSRRDVDPQREIDYLLKGVRNFAQHVHTDLYVEKVRSQAKGMKDSEARKVTMQSADQRERDGRWLRQQAEQLRLEPDTMLFCFAWFVDVLKHLSHIWAARLLRYYKIDMHRIEVENDCVMNPNYRPGPDGFDPYYYVDHHYKGETPVECCISDVEQAKELLKRLPKEETEDSKNKNSGNLASILKDSIMKMVDNINKNPEQITSIGNIIAKAKFDWSFMEAILCGLKEEWLMNKAIQVIVDTWKEYVSKKDDICYVKECYTTEYGIDEHGPYSRRVPMMIRLKHFDLESDLKAVRDGELERREVNAKFNRMVSPKTEQEEEPQFKYTEETFKKSAAITDMQLDLVLAELIVMGLMPPTSSQTDFRRLFSGVPGEFFLTWTGKPAQLHDFFDMLTKKKVVKKKKVPGYVSPRGSYLNIVRSHFKDGNNNWFGELNHERHIDGTDDILTKLEIVLAYSVDECINMMQTIIREHKDLLENIDLSVKPEHPSNYGRKTKSV